MPYTVELRGVFTAIQVLKSSVRAQAGLPPLVTDGGFHVTLRAGFQFTAEQLTPRGWFTDTDAAQQAIDDCCRYLASDKWTHLLEFRPTFELVAREVFQQLASRIQQLTYVELENQTVGVRTRYQPETS